MTLEYWREYRTFFHLATNWGLHESSVWRTIRRAEDILTKSRAFKLPGKKVLQPSDHEIEFIVASGPYAELYSGDRKYVIRESMQNLEERLDPNVFIRTHRSVIVRLDLIETLHKGAGGDYEVQLKSGRRLRVSRSRIEALEKKLGLSG